MDALGALFDGVPVEVAGALTNGRSITIKEILPAPRQYWPSSEAYDAHADLGPMTVMSESLLKRDLLRKYGSRCESCGKWLTKAKNASIGENADGTHSLLCRPCKQDWMDAERTSCDDEAVA